jgi:hypothetical protein
MLGIDIFRPRFILQFPLLVQSLSLLLCGPLTIIDRDFQQKKCLFVRLRVRRLQAEGLVVKGLVTVNDVPKPIKCGNWSVVGAVTDTRASDTKEFCERTCKSAPGLAAAACGISAGDFLNAWVLSWPVSTNKTDFL